MRGTSNIVLKAKERVLISSSCHSSLMLNVATVEGKQVSGRKLHWKACMASSYKKLT
jgi:hypothetical protein